MIEACLPAVAKAERVKPILLAFALLATAACGASETPEAVAGAAERNADRMDRDTEVAEARLIAKQDAEAAARADAAEQRIVEIEKEKKSQN